MATDKLIQRMVREEFRDVTLITIAHRINTIADSDRVLVLDNGRVAEFAPPQELLANPDSMYAALVREHSGDQGSSAAEAGSGKGGGDAVA